MTKTLKTIYLAVCEDLEFIRRNSPKKKIIRQLEESFHCAVELSYGLLISGSEREASHALQEIAFDLALARLKIVLEWVLACRRKYLGHITEVRSLIADFDNIETAVDRAKEMLSICDGVGAEGKKTQLARLRGVLKKITTCHENLMKSCKLWMSEVSSHSPSHRGIKFLQRAMESLVFGVVGGFLIEWLKWIWCYVKAQ